VPVREFNSYGSRRGNHEVMMRGTFANIRIRNEMLDGVEGGYTKGPDGKQTSIFDAAMAWQEQGVPLVIFGGRNTARAPAATGRPRARRCWASRR
jgi:aconitate hydratase